MDYYNLNINGINDKDKPIAKIGSKVISLRASNKKERGKQEFYDKKATIEPLPFIPENQNLRYFITGQSGCGKSTLVSMLLKNYVKLYPKQEIFLFSAKNHDPALDDDKLLKNKIKRGELETIDELEVDDLSNSIVVFDDASTLNPKVQKNIDRLQDEINKRGRSIGIDIMNVNDVLAGGASTKKKFLHANYLGFFPHTGGNKNEIIYTLNKKMGMEMDKVNEMFNVNSRYVLLHKNYPNFFISSDKIKIF